MDCVTYFMMNAKLLDAKKKKNYINVTSDIKKSYVRWYDNHTIFFNQRVYIFSYDNQIFC